jgi:putative membrane protein
MLFAALGLFAAVVMGIARWATTVYSIRADRITLRSGILSPDERLVPRARISSVDVVAGPLQRALGVVELHVQAAGGGGEAEIVLRALSPEQARIVREQLGHAREEVEPDANWRLSGRGLLTAAFTAPQAGALIPIAAAAGALLQDFSQAGDSADVRELVPDQAGALIAAAAGLIALLALVAVAGALLAFGGFEVRREDQLLRIRRGLLERRAATIPLARVHAVRVVENPLRQMLGVASVHVETIAHGNERGVARTLLPLVKRDELPALLAQLLPTLTVPPGPLARPPARSLRRYATLPALAGLLGGVAATLIDGDLWPLIAVLTCAGAAAGALRFRDAGWALDGAGVTMRSRSFSRRTLVARAARLQRTELRANPLQRRAGLATAGLVVGAGRSAQIAHLDENVARSLLERLRTSAAG